MFRKPPTPPPDPDAIRALGEAQAAARVAAAQADRKVATEQRRAAREAQVDREKAAAAQRTEQQKDHADARAKRKAMWSRWRRRARVYSPLAVVTGTAFVGQVITYSNAVTPWHDAPDGANVGMAVMIAGASEIIALYVGWHAHDALLRKDTNTAGKLRRTSYLIASLIAFLNYSHFVQNGHLLKPTTWAVVFGLCSLASPWLWGLHSRREQSVQLTAEGRADSGGALFSGERIRAFPWRSWQARRWSIDHGVTDPGAAWRGYNATRTTRSRRRTRGAVAGSGLAWVTAPAGVPTLPIVSTGHLSDIDRTLAGLDAALAVNDPVTTDPSGRSSDVTMTVVNPAPMTANRDDRPAPTPAPVTVVNDQADPVTDLATVTASDSGPDAGPPAEPVAVVSDQAGQTGDRSVLRLVDHRRPTTVAEAVRMNLPTAGHDLKALHNAVQMTIGHPVKLETVRSAMRRAIKYGPVTAPGGPVNDRAVNGHREPVTGQGGSTPYL